jgi:large subunit ribosomal protein L18
MLSKKLTKRDKKKIRIRKKLVGKSERPRIVVYRSLKQIYAQLVDDVSGKTILSASSLSKEISDEIKNSKDKLDVSFAVGELLAKKAKEKGIEKVVFDRSGYAYHGRVKAVAEGARKGGLIF